MTKLSENEQKRYTRQMMIEGWGEETQRKLKKSTAFIAGAGGLGSPVSIYLAVAGIGNMRTCDFDSPDWSNLNRQILHDHTRIGTNKAVSAKMTLERLNPDITVSAFTDEIVEENVDTLVGNAPRTSRSTRSAKTRTARRAQGSADFFRAEYFWTQMNAEKTDWIRERNIN